MSSTPLSQWAVPVTPKMSRLFGSPSLESTVSSFFGSISYLDTQNLFDDIFGWSPLILDTQPVKDTPVEYISRFHTYADKCMLGICFEICREDYVGGNDAGSKSKRT